MGSWLLFATIVGVCSCSTSRPHPPALLAGSDHPLNGRIWNPAAASYVSEPELDAELGRARIVLLGEQHDNPVHHQLQARILESLVTRGKRPVVAFEMITTDRSDALMRCREGCCTPRRMANAVRWNESGWPDWRTYRPIFEVIYSHDLIPVAAGLPKSTIRSLTGQSEGSSMEREIWPRMLGLDAPLDPAIAAAMAAEIVEAHCGHAPESMIDAMVLAQRARDAFMARAVEAAATSTSTVLVAGAGHVRTDRAVPAYLRGLPTTDLKPVVTVAFLGVRDGASEPADYGDDPGGLLPYDYVWFTDRVDDEDPCEKFREQLERMEPAAASGDRE